MAANIPNANIPQILVLLERIARELVVRDVIGLLDGVDQWGRRYAGRVVIVGGAPEERQALLNSLSAGVGSEADQGVMLWGEIGLTTEPQAGIGAEVVLCLDDDARLYERMAGELWMPDQWSDAGALRRKLEDALTDSERRAALQTSALMKVAHWCLVELEIAYKLRNSPHPPTPSPQMERGSQGITDQVADRARLRRDVETEVNYLTQRLADDFNSFRYRNTDVGDLETFNASVQGWLAREMAMLSEQLNGLAARVGRDAGRSGVSADKVDRALPEVSASAPELTTRPIPADDRTRVAVSLGGGGLIAVVAGAFFSSGPVAALATGAAASLAAYIALGQSTNREGADPVQAYFGLMERTTIAELRAQIERAGAALTSVITPADRVADTHSEEIGKLLEQVREALNGS